MFIQVYTIPNNISNFKSNCIQFATTTRPINPYGVELALIPSNDRLKLGVSMNSNSPGIVHIAFASLLHFFSHKVNPLLLAMQLPASILQLRLPLLLPT